MHKFLKRTTTILLALILVLSLVPMGRADAASMNVGSSGSQVKVLQQNLKGLGYLDGASDGAYGAQTAGAVRKFQSGFGLSADGVAGDATQTALRNAVVRLQVELLSRGYAPGGADGHYGSATAAALKAFQRSQGPEQTGQADQATRSRLNQTSSSMNVTKTMRWGSSGRDVKILQQALIGLGYLSGSADGVYGGQTSAAVKLYQADYGLSTDGVAGPNTLVSLNATIVALQSDLNRAGYSCGSADGIYGEGVKYAVKRYQSAKGLAVTGIAGAQTMNQLYGRNLNNTSTNNFGKDGVYKIWIDSLYQDGDWRQIWYGSQKQYATTVGKSGCAGVSLAMAMNALLDTNVYDGQNVMQWFADHGYYLGSGTYQSGLAAYPRRVGLGATYCDTGSALVSHLKQGRLAIAIIRDRTGDAFFTYPESSGHFILISGYRQSNGVDQIFVNNPLSYKATGWFDLKDLMDNVLVEWHGYDNSFVIIYR